MIQYLSHEEINKEKWDKCIRHAFNGNMYALSWYLDVVHNQWEALVENDYERVMPLTGAKKFGIWYLFQPFFTQQLGVFSTHILNAEIVNHFIEQIPEKYRFAQINLNFHNRPVARGFKLFPQKDYLLDLIQSYRKLSSNYSKNTRRNLKKARASNLTLNKGLRPEVLVKLFRENKGRDVKHWKNQHYLRLQHLMYTAVYHGSAVLYGVYSANNALCAGAFFLKSHNRLVFLFSATNDCGRETGAMTFLIDSVISEWASSQVVLDFEGSNNPDLARFYRGFGAKEVSYLHLQYNRLPFIIRHLVTVIKLMKKNVG